MDNGSATVFGGRAVSADWQVGDLALCIASDWQWSITPEDLPLIYPAKGSITPVTRVVAEDAVRLGLDGYPRSYKYAAQFFTKVTPEEADEFDRETIALLNGQPITEPGHFTPCMLPHAEAKGEVSDSLRPVHTQSSRPEATLFQIAHDLGVGEP
jgi:hypothetical protein